MSLFDFLKDANGWQWVGLIFLVGVTLHGIAAICAAIFKGQAP